MQNTAPPDEIAIEVTRDLKLSRAARASLEKEQSQRQTENDRIRKSLQEIFKEASTYKPTAIDKKRYLLWEELGRNHVGNLCLYCGKPISASQLFNGEAEIEHILPFSELWTIR